MGNYTSRIRVAILGSGQGTNARALCTYARDHAALFEIGLIISTTPGAGILDVARDFGIASCVAASAETFASDLCRELDEHRIEILLLAGLMRHLPQPVLAAVNGNVLNIHPSLLPSHGGKGMYGLHVHRAVLAAGDTATGATVHLVTDVYDEGRIVAQEGLDVHQLDTPESLQERVKQVEHHLYPRAVDKFCQELLLRPQSAETTL